MLFYLYQGFYLVKAVTECLNCLDKIQRKTSRLRPCTNINCSKMTTALFGQRRATVTLHLPNLITPASKTRGEVLWRARNITSLVQTVPSFTLSSLKGGHWQVSMYCTFERPILPGSCVPSWHKASPEHDQCTTCSHFVLHLCVHRVLGQRLRSSDTFVRREIKTTFMNTPIQYYVGLNAQNLMNWTKDQINYFRKPSIPSLVNGLLKGYVITELFWSIVFTYTLTTYELFTKQLGLLYTNAAPGD